MELKKNDFFSSLSSEMGWEQTTEENLWERMNEKLPKFVSLAFEGRVQDSVGFALDEFDYEAIFIATNDDELDGISESRIKNNRVWKHVIALIYVVPNIDSMAPDGSRSTTWIEVPSLNCNSAISSIIRFSSEFYSEALNMGLIRGH
jgi:hypothetical protein